MENNFKGQALNSNVILQELPVENLTAGGIDISDDIDKNEKYRAGIVVSIGEHLPRNDKGEPYLKIGDEVVYDKYKATKYTQDGVAYQTCYYADLFLKK